MVGHFGWRWWSNERSSASCAIAQGTYSFRAIYGVVEICLESITRLFYKLGSFDLRNFDTMFPVYSFQLIWALFYTIQQIFFHGGRTFRIIPSLEDPGVCFRELDDFSLQLVLDHLGSSCTDENSTTFKRH